MPAIQVSKELISKVEYLARQSNLSLEDYLDHWLSLHVQNQDLSFDKGISFQTLAENLLDTIYIFDFEAHQVDYINRDSFLGYSLDQLKSPQSLFEHTAPEHIEALQQYWSTLYTGTQTSYVINCQIKDVSGTWHWIKIRHVVLTRCEDKRPARILFHLTDVTNIKQAEQQSSLNAKRYESIISAMNEGVIFQRVDGTIETCNPAAERLIGARLDQLIGKSPLDSHRRAIHEDGSDFPPETYPAMISLKTGQPQSNVIMGMYNHDGNLTWISINSEAIFADDNLSLIGVVTTLTDISRQKHQEEELIRLTQAIEQSPVSVMITDLQAQISYVNPKFSQLTGYSAAEAIHHSPSILKSGHTPRETYDKLWEAIETGTEWRGEFLNKKKNGEFYWEYAIISPIRNSQGDITHYLSINQDVTERKRIEAELLETEARYRTLFDNSQDAVILTTGDGTIIDINKVGIALLGYTYDELKQMNALDLYVLKEDREAIKLLADERGGLSAYDVRLKRKDGTALYLHASVSIRKSADDNSILYYQTVMRDITAEKQAQNALKESEQTSREFQQQLLVLHEMRFELAKIESIDVLYRRSVEIGLVELNYDRVGLFLIDDESNSIKGTYGTDQNGMIRNEYDYQSPLQAQSLWVSEVLDSKEHAVLWENVSLMDYNKPVATGWNAQAALWDGDKAIGFFAIDNYVTQRAPRPYERELLSLYGRTIGHLVARRRIIDAMRKSQERIRSLLENAPIAILVLGLDSKIEITNPQSAHLFAYSEQDELLGLNIDALVPGIWGKLFDNNSDFYAHTGQLPRLHLGLDRDIFGLSKQGDSIPLEVDVTSMFLDNEAKIICFISDLSEHIQVENQRVLLALEHERSIVLSRFIRDASHEFKTPLSVIKMKTFLLGKLVESEREIDHLQMIDHQVDGIEQLVNDLALIARLDGDQALTFQPQDLHHIIENIVQKMATRITDKQLQIKLERDSNLVPINGNAEALAEGLERLIDNAIRYSLDKGLITIRTEQGDDRVMISIADNGIGIESKYLDRVFERFFRVDEAHSTRGFGLGLSIAEKTIQLHQGSIQIESKPGQGTTVRISLPT